MTTTIKLIAKGGGNDPKQPNGMNTYLYKEQKVSAYNVKDVPNRYKFLFPKN